jgi:HEPN superfamily AbiU2-like protein
MVRTKQRLEQTIEALCDELYWGIRSFYAAKIVFETELRLTPTLFDTFYFSCLDQSVLILTRIVVAKEDSKDDESINLQYLANQAKNNPSAFKHAKPGDVKSLLEKQVQLFELHSSLIAILKDQRDQNLAHLDRRHINDPDWRKSQTQLYLSQVEKLYQDLIGVMTTYHGLFFGGKLAFADWESVTKAEVKNLVEYHEVYQSKL